MVLEAIQGFAQIGLSIGVATYNQSKPRMKVLELTGHSFWCWSSFDCRQHRNRAQGRE